AMGVAAATGARAGTGMEGWQETEEAAATVAILREEEVMVLRPARLEPASVVRVEGAASVETGLAVESEGTAETGAVADRE
ncbi:MAG TPA: hypothetical protein VNI57_10380, partial [Candidatus Saccharimonadales bacterium]|nr:hypothetical protein [Candidatus Saccharimonadales bacterium]